jgi:hypothetical protein
LKACKKPVKCAISRLRIETALVLLLPVWLNMDGHDYAFQVVRIERNIEVIRCRR